LSFSGFAAFGTSCGLICKAFLLIKLLFSGSKSKRFAAVSAFEFYILHKHGPPLNIFGYHIYVFKNTQRQKSIYPPRRRSAAVFAVYNKF
jgi:hypothetical protein